MINPPAIAKIQKNLVRRKNLLAIILIRRALRNHHLKAIRVQIKNHRERKKEAGYEKTNSNSIAFIKSTFQPK